jgi:nucleoside phosphorylase
MYPHSRDDFTIAIICALTLEAEAVEELFDETYDRLSAKYGKHPQDHNAYMNGRLGKHDVVLCYLPEMGTRSAASMASSLRFSYKNIQIALVVGICGGVPQPSNSVEIFLGDVLISDSIIEYDFGKQYPRGFQRKTDAEDILGRPNQEIRSILAGLKAKRLRIAFQAQMSQHVHKIQQVDNRWKHPQLDDVLYSASYPHQHYDIAPANTPHYPHSNPSYESCWEPCHIAGCDENQIVRRRHCREARSPLIHIGAIASASSVMKSGEHRDKLVQNERVIGFEMEAAGVWDSLPCIIIKGICDYADSHKNDSWQAYAAATGAAAAKTFLHYWRSVGQRG